MTSRTKRAVRAFFAPAAFTPAFFSSAVLTSAVAAAVVALLGASAADAGAKDRDIARPLSLVETRPAEPPRGFVELCERRRELCPARNTAGEVDPVETTLVDMFGADALRIDAPELTPERLWTLERVNAAVNARIRPIDDVGRDLWDLSAMAGDCEEYVLMKREMLARLGWPRALLRVAVVEKDGREAGQAGVGPVGDAGSYHAVLLVSTQAGDFVLDNIEPEVMRIGEAPYRFLVAESVQNPGDWAFVRR